MKKHLPTYSEHIGRKKPIALFHYTSPNGLIGMIESKQIWATDIRYLNDSKEFDHALDIFADISTDYYKFKENRPKRIKNIEPTLMEQVQDKIWKEWDHQVYVVSFSEEGDLLSQWRGYCPKGGYSIGFDFNHLSNVAQKNDCDLKPCIYDPKAKKRIIEELLHFHNRMLVRLREKSKKYTEIELNKIIANRFMVRLFAIAPILKDESFAEEKEWRIVSSRLRVKPTVHFRASESKIVPYIKLRTCDKLSDLVLRGVVCGPSSNGQFAKRAVMKLLEECRLPHYKILLSKTPYRNH